MQEAFHPGKLIEKELQEIDIHNWASQPWTSASDRYDEHDGPSAQQAHRFGHPRLRVLAFGGKVSFAATESEALYGHMEGALKAGERAAAEAFSCVHGM